MPLRVDDEDDENEHDEAELRQSDSGEHRYLFFSESEVTIRIDDARRDGAERITLPGRATT